MGVNEMSVRTRSFYMSVLLLAFGAVACQRGDDGVYAARESLSPAAVDFTQNAAKANMAEIEIARIARQRAQSDEVRDYAEDLFDEHTKGLDQLEDIMKENNLAVDMAMDPQNRQDIDRLNSLSGVEFDREFINMMVSNHMKAVDTFRRASNTIDNSDLRDYAGDSLPKLENHLQKAQELQSKLFGGGRT